MNVSPTGLAVAFSAGVAGVLSPCVLPLVPGYLSFVSGVSAGELDRSRARVLRCTAAFVLGFGAVFTIAGVGVGLLGAQFVDHRQTLELIGGLLVIAFGLVLLLPLGIPGREWRLPQRARPRGPVGAGLTGAAFAVGWSPCLTPTLASILTIAGTSGRGAEGAALLAAYSLGLGLPFLAAGVFLGTFLTASRVIRAHLHAITLVAGVVLVATGYLLATGQMEQITARLNQ